MINIYQEKFDGLLAQMKTGKRALFSPSKEEITNLNNFYYSYSPISEKDLTPLIGLMQFADRPILEFEPLIIEQLGRSDLSDSLIIHILGAAPRHCFEWRLMEGLAFDDKLNQTLRNLLKSKNPEITEWALRTICEMGPRSIVYREAVNQCRPKIWKIFSKKQQTILELIEFLENTWRKS